MWMDQYISNWVLENISKNEFVAQIAKVLSEFTSWGQLWILILIALMVYHYIKEKKIVTYYLIALVPIIIGWAFSEYFLKDFFNRTRPYLEIEGFKTLMETIGYEYPSGNSFPSGHTLISFAAAFVIFKRDNKFTYYAYALATLIGISRIILGAHYFSDVIAGAGYGTLIGAIGCILADKFASIGDEKLTKKLIKGKQKDATR